MALFLFTKNILAGKPIDVFNYGHHRRDFTYVGDIAQGVVRAMDRVAQPNPTWSGDAPDPATSQAPYRIYNIGNQRPVELMRYIEVLEECLGRKAEKNLCRCSSATFPIPGRTSRTSSPTSAIGRARRSKSGRPRLRRLVPRVLQVKTLTARLGMRCRGLRLPLHWLR